MVGWSRRNSESAARRRRYEAWLATLPPEEQERRRAVDARAEAAALRIAGFGLLFLMAWVAFGLFFSRGPG